MKPRPAGQVTEIGGRRTPEKGEQHGHPTEGSAVWISAACLVAAIFLAYANGLGGPFVYDDVPTIVDNPSIRHLGSLGDVLFSFKQGGLTTSGRPLLNLSFAINYALGGTRPLGYHVMNVLIHAGGALLLFGTVRRTLLLTRWRERFGAVATPLALGAAALWALHPLQTQAVTYTVQRAESLMGFFYWLTFYAYVRGVGERRRSGAWLAFAVAACALGMGAKEVMATAPLLVLLHDRTFAAGSFEAAWRQRRGFYVALALTWVVLAWLVISTGGNRGGTVGFGTGVPWWAYWLTQFQAVVRYLGLAAWPRPLIFEYGTFWVKRAGEVLPYALVLLPLLGATLVALRRWPVVGFFGAWFFGILATSSLPPGTIQMIVEHRPYLSLAACAVAGTLGLYAVAGNRWAPRAVLVLALACGILTSRRNADYRSALALWSDTVAKRPGNPRAHQGVGEALIAMGQTEAGIAHYRESVRLLPDESDYHYNLGAALVEVGQVPEAIACYEEAIRLRPNEPNAHSNLGVALVETGDVERALAQYAEAVRLAPGKVLFHYNYAVGLTRVGRKEEAIQRYEQVLALDPAHADAHLNLGAALMELGRVEEALAHLAEAVRLKPGDNEARVNYGEALLVAKRNEEARGQFAEALKTQPGHAKAMLGLANANALSGRTAEAIPLYETVLRAQPDSGDVHYKLGNALIDAERLPEAIEQYRAAVRLVPGDAEAHHNLGIAYARLDQLREAEKEFAEAVRLKPGYLQAQQHLEQVRGLLRP